MPLYIGLPTRLFATLNVKLQKFLLFFLWPFLDYALYRRLYLKSVELQKKYHFDAVIGVHNPIEALVAVNHLGHKYKELPCIYYYIDALSGGNLVRMKEENFRHLFFRKIFFKMAKRWEVYISQGAKRIIAMEAARDHYTKYFVKTELYDKLVFLNVPLFEEPRTATASLQDTTCPIMVDNKITVLFCGSIYSLRDPTYIIKVVELLDRDDIQWVFIGSYDRKFKKILCDAQTRNPERFKIYDRIPHDQLVHHLNRADFFLNIGERLPSVFSGKVFEYISYGKPIISTFPIRDNSSIAVLQKYPNSLILFDDEDIYEATEKLRHFLNENFNKRISYNTMEKLLRTSTPDAFVDTIESVLAETAHV
ncbi:MAG: glycosyltransferase [Thermoguttaceae bacterium]